MGEPQKEITSLAQLTRKQVELVLGKATMRGKGTFTPPPLDLDAIRKRADTLDPKSQLKADIYGLLLEVKRLRSR